MALAELDQDPLGVGGFETPGRLEGGGEQSALLGHCAFLCFEEVALIGVEDENTGHGQEDDQHIERQQPDGDAGEPAEWGLRHESLRRPSAGWPWGVGSGHDSGSSVNR